jgi:hypothetical protein
MSKNAIVIIASPEAQIAATEPVKVLSFLLSSLIIHLPLTHNNLVFIRHAVCFA